MLIYINIYIIINYKFIYIKNIKIHILKAQNKKYAEKLVSVERQQAKKAAIQNSQDTNYELKEKNHRLIEEIEVIK